MHNFDHNLPIWQVMVSRGMSSHEPTINLPHVLVVAKVIDFVVAPEFFLKNFDFLYEITFISLLFFLYVIKIEV